MPRKNIELAVSATGDLPLKQTAAALMIIAPSYEDEVPPVANVGTSVYSLDQDLNVKVAWKHGCRKRRVEQRFNLRRVQREYINRL